MRKERVSLEAGFTLIELMLTLVILALLLAIAVPAMGQVTTKAASQTRLLSIESLERAGEFAYQLGLPLDVNVPEGLTEKHVYTVKELEDQGFLKLSEKSEFRDEEHYVKRMPSGEFVYMGTGLDEEVLPELPEVPVDPSYPDDDYCPKDAGIYAVEAVATGTKINGFKDGYEPESTDLVLPTTICGSLVSELGDYAFEQEGLTSVVLPAGLTEIPHYAFRANKLETVDVPSEVTYIGDYSFASNELMSVELPEGLDEIGSNAFLGNKLTGVDIPDSVTYMNTAAFSMNLLTHVEIPDGITIIEDNLFHENNLTSVVIPASVKEIGRSAFIMNDLTSVSIPAGVTWIGEYAFSENKLTSVTLPAGLSVIERYAFYRNDLVNVTIPTNVTAIHEYAFYGNDIVVVDLPQSVVFVGYGAYSDNLITQVSVRNRLTAFDVAVLDKYTFSKVFSHRAGSAITPRGYATFSGGGPTLFGEMTAEAGYKMQPLP